MGILDKLRALLSSGGIGVGQLENAATKKRPAILMGRNLPAQAELPDNLVVTDEYQSVLETLKQKAPIVFVTGGPGTGKYTLIRWLLPELECRAAVVAPTEVSALNIGGATIHSFFHFPPQLIKREDTMALRVTDRKLYAHL